jgi:D-arginine dehydrogenase
MASRESFDVAIVGAGIAGASLAYFLSERGITDVLVVEREAQPGYHASGRSAATVVELDAIDTIRRLKIQGARFLRNPPPGFAPNPVLDQSGVLSLFREPFWGQLRQVEDFLRGEGADLRFLTPREANERVGGLLNEAEFDGAVFAPEDGFIDIHELLSAYIRNARERGVEFRFDTEVRGLLCEDGVCRGIVTAAGEIRARQVVNAAGAWVGEIAERSGALPIDFKPLRRSIVILPLPEGVDARGWPLTWSDPHNVYFRPEATGILFCPMDEEPTAPCDVSPDDAVFAAGLERLGRLAPRLVPRTLGRRWAGLRTFAPDRIPVVGPDPLLPGFFWLAGQGGCGIETSPAVGRIAADLLATGTTAHFDASLLAPARFQ